MKEREGEREIERERERGERGREREDRTEETNAGGEIEGVRRVCVCVWGGGFSVSFIS